MITEGQTEIRVRCWDDPLVDQLGLAATSDYAETYWLPVLGPTALVLLRRLATLLDYYPDGFDLDIDALAASMGLSAKLEGQASKAIGRLSRFGLSKPSDGGLAVRRLVPVLSARLVERLPEVLRADHDRYLAAMGVAA